MRLCEAVAGSGDRVLVVATTTKSPSGTLLRLRIDLADGAQIVLNGGVPWLRSTATPDGRPATEVAFLTLPAHAPDRISVYFSTRPPPLFDG